MPSAITTVPGAATCCSRAARFGVSPTTACSRAAPSPTKSPTTTRPVAMPMQNVDQTARFQGKSAKDLEAALEIHCELGTDHKPKDSAEVIQYGVRPTVTASTGRGGRKSEEVLLFSGPQLCAVEGRISGRPQIPEESRMAVAEFELALGYTMVQTMAAHEGPSGDLPKGAALGALLRSLAEKKENAPGFDATPAMARAQGAEGIGPITKLADLRPAIDKGIAIVRDGGVCVVDVHVTPGYDANVSGAPPRR